MILFNDKPCFSWRIPQATLRQHDAIVIVIVIANVIVMRFFLPRLCKVLMYIFIPVNAETLLRPLASLRW